MLAVAIALAIAAGCLLIVFGHEYCCRPHPQEIGTAPVPALPCPPLHDLPPDHGIIVTAGTELRLAPGEHAFLRKTPAGLTIEALPPFPDDRPPPPLPFAPPHATLELTEGQAIELMALIAYQLTRPGAGIVCVLPPRGPVHSGRLLVCQALPAAVFADCRRTIQRYLYPAPVPAPVEAPGKAATN